MRRPSAFPWTKNMRYRHFFYATAGFTLEQIALVFYKSNGYHWAKMVWCLMKSKYHIASRKEKKMEVKDYCKGMQMELTAWKAKLYDVLTKFDKLGTAEKEKAFQNIENLRMVVADLEDKICSLEVECPSDWSPAKKEIEDAHLDMRSKYDETIELIGKASPVSIPGWSLNELIEDWGSEWSQRPFLPQSEPSADSADFKGIQNMSEKKSLYVRVHDNAGNEFICPIDALKDPKTASNEELDQCVDDGTVGRYAGNIKVVDPE
jgi:hypothetical protein